MDKRVYEDRLSKQHQVLINIIKRYLKLRVKQKSRVTKSRSSYYGH